MKSNFLRGTSYRLITQKKSASDVFASPMETKFALLKKVITNLKTILKNKSKTSASSN